MDSRFFPILRAGAATGGLAARDGFGCFRRAAPGWRARSPAGSASVSILGAPRSAWLFDDPAPYYDHGLEASQTPARSKSAWQADCGFVGRRNSRRANALDISGDRVRSQRWLERWACASREFDGRETPRNCTPSGGKTVGFPQREIRHRLPASYASLGPISILIASGLLSTAFPCAGHANASMPSSTSAAARASAWMCIDGDETHVFTQYEILNPDLVIAGIPAGGSPTASPDGDINTQLASRNAPTIWFHRSHASPTPCEIDPTNCWPENCPSFLLIRARCSGESIRGALNLASSAWASNARAFAAATFSSDSLLASPVATIARPITTYSRIKPTAIRMSAVIDATRSPGSCGNQKSDTISIMMPASIVRVARADHRSSASSLWCGSFFLWPKAEGPYGYLIRRRYCRFIVFSVFIAFCMSVLFLFGRLVG